MRRPANQYPYVGRITPLGVEGGDTLLSPPAGLEIGLKCLTGGYPNILYSAKLLTA